MSKNKEYIEKYAEYAMEQMRRYGIPASVTLAQGICESASGQSELSRKGNNHFGIKATSSWIHNGGKYLVYTDDRPNEKFCQYASVGDSYEHHSKFLKENHRYAVLFKLSPDDYKGWTTGLQKAGYASSGKYASTLQSIIEANDLQKYDRMVMQEMQAQGKSFGVSGNRRTSERRAELAQAFLSEEEEGETNPRHNEEPPTQKGQNDTEDKHYSYPLKRDEFMLVTSPFGMRDDPINPGTRQMHKGIDIQAKNDEVLATEDKGKVIKVNNSTDGGSGRYVTVEYSRPDDNKYQCTYMHLSSIDVKVGDEVNAGQKLGMSGNSGTRTTGAHLHFSVKSVSSDGTKRDIDPAAYLAEISQRGGISLQTLYNGKDITAQYKEQNPTAGNPISEGTTNRWSSESRSQTCLDYAESRQRKTIVNPEDWMKKLLSSEDSSVNMPLGDPVIELMMTIFTSLMALALQIDNKSEEEKMQKATEAAVTKSIDLTSLLPSYKICSITLQDNKPFLQVDTGNLRFSRELTNAEIVKIQQTLDNTALSQEEKQRSIAAIINSAVVSRQVSQNYENGMGAQADRQETVKIR